MNMNDPDSNAWVFDSLVGFLHGPVWNVPLQTFIEEKSLPFEPTDSGEVIDRPEYKKIHDEYRNLVDVMLGSFMDDIGISADQFEAACRISAHDLADLPAYFHKRLFEQIWAANDYDMFVKMMTHKNVELQLQALELIERRYGVLPNLFSSDSEDLDTSRSEEEDGWQDNDDVMTEIKKLQLNDVEGTDDAVAVPPEDVVVEKKSLLSKLQTFDKKAEIIEKKETKLEKKDDSDHISKTKRTEPIIPVQKVEVSEEDIRARQEYLKQQRDKLLALKKQVREKQLGAAETPSELGAPWTTTFLKPAPSVFLS
ncbi:PREDICTED: cilia- and flagella-associated protein 36 isoform X2 [Papilio polytes]|uniref:cilia- and flagella-associated protein 36 isoform X2 n=1 Tax=Papilio polytes TaxID=76194 RepID=UPI000676A788|nr:PREDICTED: cilia- and flagella-associated protein 36 isoform X2 [Papilio polytes]